MNILQNMRLRRMTSRDGSFRIENANRWLFLSIGGDAYRAHLTLGHFSIALERPLADITKRVLARRDVQRVARVSAEEMSGSGKCAHGKSMLEECRHCWSVREEGELS